MLPFHVSAAPQLPLINTSTTSQLFLVFLFFSSPSCSRLFFSALATASTNRSLHNQKNHLATVPSGGHQGKGVPCPSPLHMSYNNVLNQFLFYDINFECDGAEGVISQSGRRGRADLRGPYDPDPRHDNKIRERVACQRRIFRPPPSQSSRKK